jgi:hypothetical protein
VNPDEPQTVSAWIFCGTGSSEMAVLDRGDGQSLRFLIERVKVKEMPKRGPPGSGIWNCEKAGFRRPRDYLYLLCSCK